MTKITDITLGTLAHFRDSTFITFSHTFKAYGNSDKINAIIQTLGNRQKEPRLPFSS